VALITMTLESTRKAEATCKKKGMYGDQMRVRTESKEYARHDKLNY